MILKTPLEKLYQWETEAPDRIFLRQPIEGRWNDFSWKQAADQVRRVAAYLDGCQLPPGSPIGLISKNCAHWLMADFAIWMSGHVSVPLYPNATSAEIRQILEHSACKLIFVGKLDKWAPVEEGVPSTLKKISFPFEDYPGCARWNDIVKDTPPLTGTPNRHLEEVATIIYTSGTTGDPKGVVHTFQSPSYAGTHILESISVGPKDRFFSYLPLAHVAERLLTETVALYAGATVYFAESLDTFTDNLKTARPTRFLGVPRIWTKFQMGVLEKVPAKKLERLLRIPILSGFIRKKIKKGLGLDAAVTVITGAAPTPASLVRWFRNLSIPIQEAYGLTENFAYSHLPRPESKLVGFSGKPMPGVECKIGENGEILVKSAANMKGYYKAPEETAKAFDGEYLRTGDTGEIGPDGYLKIDGRIKDTFKTAKGKYVAPEPLELTLLKNTYVEQVCVVGSGMTQPLALIVVSESGKKLPTAQLNQALQDSLNDLNNNVHPHERIAKIVLIPEPWTPENGLLTPSLKMRRHKIEKKYNALFDTWASTSDGIIAVAS